MKNFDQITNKIIAELDLSVPINVNEVAKRYNIQIRKTASEDFSGLLFRKNEVAFMAINSKESLVRQRFTVAHELGHFFLHQDRNTFIEYRNNAGNVVRNRKEMEANKFAAALLMPKSFLENDIKKLTPDSISENEISYLSKKYNVSEESMTYRLINLNLVNKISE